MYRRSGRGVRGRFGGGRGGSGGSGVRVREEFFFFRERGGEIGSEGERTG